MIDFSMVSKPIVGAIIGYTTNWLAIKMLFKPHEAKYIGKLKVPFTPGLIPRERERIARSLGTAVGERLLTKEVISKELLDERVIGHIKSYVINELLDKDIAIGDILKAIMGDDYKQASSKIVDAIEDYLSKSTEDDSFNDLLTSHISDYISDKYPHNASIETMMPDNAEEKLKVILEGQKDKISQFIVDESRNEEVVAKLKVIVANLLMEKVGAMAAMFVNPDDVALSILDYVGKTVFEPEVQDGMIMALVRGVSQSKQMTLSEVLSIENYDDMLKHMIESIVSNATEVTKQMNMKPLIESGVHYFLSMKLHLSQPDKEKKLRPKLSCFISLL